MPAVDERQREAQAYLDRGAPDKAHAAYKTILASSPDAADAWLGLSRAAAGLDHQSESEAALSRAYQIAPKHPAIAGAVAEKLLSNAAAGKAVQVLQRALHAAPDDLELLRLLATAYEMNGDKSAVLKVCHRLAKLAPDDPTPRLKSAGIRLRNVDYEGAEAEFRAALQIDPTNPAALDGLANVARLAGNIADAQNALLRRAEIETNPSLAAIARFKAASIQPVIARDEQEIDETRARFAAALAAGPQEPIEDPFKAGLGPNFFLNYQARDERPLVEALARYHLAATPSLAFTAKHIGRSVKSRRIRVGIVSAFLSKHVVGYLSYGLISGLDRSRFELVLFRPPTAEQDSQTQRFMDAAPCITLPAGLAAARAMIAEAQLDILHFTEIGMDHFVYFLAFSRLATLQTVSWGHPVTSGLTTIDLFLSADGMEPPNGASHYTEELVRLKQLSFAGARMPKVEVDRMVAGFGPGPAYVCAQSLYKIHPQFDAVLARILKEDREGILYFLSMGKHADALFTERFAAHAGNSMARVKILPRTTADGFLARVGAADVGLDVTHWSGGKTSLDSFSMGTPVVHLPGEFMRGRHTTAFYRHMGIDAPVVESTDAYVKTAIKLVHDKGFSADVRGQIKEAQSRLFEDWASIREIEEVWTGALNARTG